MKWYQAYNTVKHNRHDAFESASLENVLSAMGGVLAILFSQFAYLSFKASPPVNCYSYDEGWFSHEDSIFRVKPAVSWSDDECYDFCWDEIKNKDDRFARFFS